MSEKAQDVNVSIIRRSKVLFYIFVATLSTIAAITLIYDMVINFPVTVSLSSFWVDIPNTIAMGINFAFAIISITIAVDAHARFQKNKKPSPFLLSLMFIFLTCTMAIQVSGTLTTFSVNSFFSEFLKKSVWLFLGTSVFFQFLFILDIFKDGVLNPKNKPMTFFFIIADIAMYAMMTFSMFNDYFKVLDPEVQETIVIASSALIIFALMVAFIIQASASFKMRRSVQEAIYRRSVLFIGLSGICFLMAVFSEFFEELARMIIDDVAIREVLVDFSTWFSPAMTLVGGVLIYLGYIYPSKLKNENK